MKVSTSQLIEFTIGLSVGMAVLVVAVVVVLVVLNKKEREWNQY